MSKFLKILFGSSRTELEKNEQLNESNRIDNVKKEQTMSERIEELKNNAEEILDVISYDWKKQTLVDDVIEPMIALLEEQQIKIKELEDKLSLKNDIN